MPRRSLSGLLIRPRQVSRPLWRPLARLLVLLVPAGILLAAALRSNPGGSPQLLLILGTAIQILLCVVSLRALGGRSSIGPAALLLYLTGLGWLWLGRGLSDLDDWYLHLAQAVLLLVSLGIFAGQVLLESGAPDWRRAQLLARRLRERSEWPTDLAACRALPEVKAFREALHFDASPAIHLLGHPRMQVRVAALAALEFRNHWRPGQAEAVLQVAYQAREPAVRVAALCALANVDDRLLVEQLAEFLRDPAPEVRRGAADALLWDTAARWHWIRLAVRRALGDSQLTDDTPLLSGGQKLTPEAVKDLTAWAAEKGFLAIRAAIVLVKHYERALNEATDEELVQELRRQASALRTPATLRIGLAQLLQQHELLDKDLQVALLDPVNPAPLRVIAADCLLADGPNERAVTALREVARLPNREIALATADVIQRRLHTDLGLPIGQAPPPLHSRLAAEVTRRVMAWAAPEAMTSGKG